MFSPPFVGVNGVNMTFLLPIHIYNIYLKSVLNTSKVEYSQWRSFTMAFTESEEWVYFPIQFPSASSTDRVSACISTSHLNPHIVFHRSWGNHIEIKMETVTDYHTHIELIGVWY